MLVCAGAMLTLTVGTASADDKVLEQLKARLDALEQQNKELQERVRSSSGPYYEVQETKDDKKAKEEKEKINKQVDSYLKEKDKKAKDDKAAKDKEKDDQGYEVGKYLDVKGKWSNSQLWFETEDKAFRLHVGGRTQIDYVAVHAPQNVQADQATGPNSGSTGAGGIGVYDDAINFRRARFAMEGTLFEVFDFNCEWDFANTARVVPSGTTPAIAGPAFASNADRANVFNTPAPTDLWMQWKKIPGIGTIRVGNQKAWTSFEHLTSSRFLDFMERSVAFDAFVENGNNGFVPGISAFNQFFDQRLSVAAGVYYPNLRDIYGFNVGDGETQVTGRIWGTPIYAQNGRCLLHLGVGYTHNTADDNVIRYRARTQLRNGPAALHNIVAIIQANSRSQNLLNPEFAFNYGAFQSLRRILRLVDFRSTGAGDH